jgi:hypothetical protein
MTAGTERAILARAHDLDDTGDLAEDVTDALGRGRGARLDPDALTSLAAAALALGADSVTVYRATGAAFTDDREMAEAVGDAEDAIADRAAAVARELAAAQTARQDARETLAAAHDDLAAAQAMPTRQPCDGCHDDRADAITAAREAVTGARERTTCAEQAITVLASLAERLARALALIRRVLPEVGEVYEPVYEHVDAGRVMPKDGDFLTGEDGAAPAATPYPCANCSGTGTSRLTTATCDRCAGTGADPYALR